MLTATPSPAMKVDSAPRSLKTRRSDLHHLQPLSGVHVVSSASRATPALTTMCGPPSATTARDDASAAAKSATSLTATARRPAARSGGDLLGRRSLPERCWPPLLRPRRWRLASRSDPAQVPV
jgi:hypothetical protein